MRAALLLVPAILLTLACGKVQPLPVKAVSEPSPAKLTLQGKILGQTPTTILLERPDDVALVRAEFEGQAPVEQRVRFLPDGRVELSFLFGEGRSATAKALGLARILVFEYAAGLTFDVDKAELKTTTLPLLERQAGLLKGVFKDIPVYLCGHTDSTGAQEHNLDLSVRRAKAVMDFFAAQGVAKERMRPQGFASAYPLESNATEEGRALNRRTEVVLGQ